MVLSGRIKKRITIKTCFAMALALLIPLAGTIMTAAPIIWPISTLIYNLGLVGCCTMLPRGHARLILYNLVAATFYIIESAFFFSYYLQNTGFNDAFFYHLRPDLLSAGISEHLPKLGLIVIFLLGFLALSSSAMSRKRTNKSWLLLPSIVLLVIGLCFSPPAKALIKFAENRSLVRSSDDLFKDFPELRVPQLTTKFTGTKRPNIVLIYAESLEQRYFDQTVFPGLLPNLTKLKNQSVDFSSVSQGVGAGWTIGGMVASQCGYPLTGAYNLTGHETGNQLGMFDNFLPKATCLGDLLAQDGYNLAFMGGANAHFAGKGDFLTSHGFKEILDRDVLTDQLGDKSYLNPWGLFDDSLLQMALDKYAALNRTEVPFLLTLLTLDTHAPKGFLSESCEIYGSGENTSLNSAHCSDQLISSFAEKIRELPNSSNTIIIVISDHLAMRNLATPQLESSQQPARLTFFINMPDGRMGKIDHPGLHYDIAPTILDLAGYTISGQMGFGTSLNRGAGYLPSRFGEKEWQLQQSTLTAISSTLWETDVNLNENGINFTVADLGLTIGGSKFNLHSDGTSEIPMSSLFIFDKMTLKLEKVVSYPLDRNLNTLDLSQQLMQFPDKLVLAISRAQNLPAFVDPRIDPNQWVYFCGKPGSDYSSLGAITGDLYIPFKLIRELSQSTLDDKVIMARQGVLESLAKISLKRQGA